MVCMASLVSNRSAVPVDLWSGSMGSKAAGLDGSARTAMCAAALVISALFHSGCAGQSATPQKPPAPPDVAVVPVVEKDVPLYSDWVATLDGFVNANIQP